MMDGDIRKMTLYCDEMKFKKNNKNKQLTIAGLAFSFFRSTRLYENKIKLLHQSMD